MNMEQHDEVNGQENETNDNLLSDNDSDDLEAMEFMKKRKICEQIVKNDNPDEEDVIVGIDLGTTNSCVGIWRNNNLEMIPDENGNRTIPSYVAFTNVSRYVGADAKNQKDINPKNVYYEIKRLIGLKYSDENVQRDKEFLTYGVIGDAEDKIKLTSELKNNKCFTPEEISANILSKLKMMATNYLKKKVDKAVITIPAYFTDAQRQATKDAAEIAGLKCVRMINEPTAAALAYGLTDRAVNMKLEGRIEPINVLVYDFGGGTLDVSVLEISNDTDEDTGKTRQIFQVLASAGNTHFGGADFDNRLMSFCISKYKRMKNIDRMGEISTIAIQKLRLSCESAKKILSTNNSAYVAVRDFYKGDDLCIQITRESLEVICGDLLLISMKNIDDVLNACDLCTDDIDEIIVVGGMTAMPTIRTRLEMKFGRKPNCSINPNEAIAAGAAIQAFMTTGQDPFSKDVTLLDINPLSLGVETIGGVMDVLIERGTIIPFDVHKMYTTDTDNEKSVNIKIFEGERSMTQDNIFIGEFELTGIPEAPRGVPEIKVTFSIDVNGIVTVTAEEQETLGKNSIIVNSNKGRLTREQIDEMIEEAKDLEIRDEIERVKKMLHYEIDDLCSNIITNINNEHFKLSEFDKNKIEKDVSIITGWLKEKKYYDRTDDELQEVVDKIKKRYGVLILRGKLEDDNLTEHVDKNIQNQSTTLYGNDEDDMTNESNHIFEQLEAEELGLKGMTEPDVAELKELRKNLFDLCYTVYDILGNDSLLFKNAHKTDLKEFVNDTLLWLHVHEKPTKIDYKEKIDEVNDACNKILSEYENNDDIFDKDVITKSNKNVWDELENLLYTLKIMIDENAFPIKKKHLEKLITTIEEQIIWIADSNYKKNNEQSFDLEQFKRDCTEKINMVNEMCTDLNNKMNGINFDQNRSVIRDVIIATDEPATGKGTSILDILKRRQEIEIQQLINDTSDDVFNIDNIDNVNDIVICNINNSNDTNKSNCNINKHNKTKHNKTKYTRTKRNKIKRLRARRNKNKRNRH